MKLAHLLLISILILQQNFHLSIPSALAYHHDNHLNVSVQSHENINGSFHAPPNSTNIQLLPDPSSCDSPPHTSPMGRFLLTNTSSMELQPHPDASINMSLSSNHSERHNSTTQKKFSFHVMDNFTDCVQTRSEKISPQGQSTDARKLLPSPAPVHKHAAQSHSDTAAQRSSAKQSVQNSMVLSEDDVVFIDEELLRRFTPPPGASTPIHTAAQRSIARDSLQVMVIDEDDVALVNKEQLGGATPPPGASTPINMAARSSIARDSVQVMVIDVDDVFLVNEEQLGRATPPPGATTPIHAAAQQSIARDSVQVMVIDEDDVVLNNEEQLGRATPPPGATTPIHSAAERSVARDSA